MEEVKHCENCKRDVSAKNYMIHTAHCERKIQLCNRCSEPVPFTELEKHEEEFHSKDACSACGISVEKWQIPKHEETCTKRLVACEYCELEISLDTLSEHTVACGSRTEHCSKCNKHVMIKDLANHPRSCSGKEPESVPCEHCGRQIDWNEVMEHIAMCGTSTERCFACKEDIMIKDRNIHFATCRKRLNFNESLQCDYCGGSFNNSDIGRHVEFCKFQAEKCDNCNNYFERKDMRLHLTMCQQNIQTKFPCQYCKELFPSALLKDHSDLCQFQMKKCEKCDKYIPLKNLRAHSNMCEEKRQLELLCQYCEELFPGDFLEDHAKTCRIRLQKCDKDETMKNMETQSNACIGNISKTLGNCTICHQSVPWVEMNVHMAYCAVAKKSETHEYERQNQFNELSLKKESETLTDENNDEYNKSQFHKDKKRCSFCFEIFPCVHFAQHLEVCQQRPYNCSMCLKAMPYRKKDEHELNCRVRKRKTYEDEYMLQVEETDDNNKLKKLKKCQFCDKRFPDVLFNDHQQDCKHQVEKCTVCLENVPVKDMPDHRLLKCNLTHLEENKNFDDHNAYTEGVPGPSKTFKIMEHLEKNVEICPSCKSKIPEERYHEHLLLCFNNETRCNFCNMKILKKNEHLHFQNCCKILEILEEDNNSHSKKNKGKRNKGTFSETIGKFLPWIMPSDKKKSVERDNIRDADQDSHSRQLNRSQNYGGYTTQVHPPNTSFNVVNELPCEFCNQMWPSEFLIEHESGCRPDLVSFPKVNEKNEDDLKFATAAATVSEISHAHVLGAYSKNITEEDNERNVQFKKFNQASVRESSDCRKKERNMPQKPLNAKEKLFYYQSQDIGEVPVNQPGSFRKKRYPQVRDSQEISKIKPDKEIEVGKDEFTSFKFSASRFNEESQNSSNFKEENVIFSTDVKNYDETKKNYDHQAPSTESKQMTDYLESRPTSEIKAVGAERKRFMLLKKDVDADLSNVHKSFEEVSLQKPITFDENNQSKPSKFFETSDSRPFNLNMPTIWNTGNNLSNSKTYRNNILTSFGNENEAKDDIVSNTDENVEHRGLNSNVLDTNYGMKNNETFRSSFRESINNNQNEEGENDSRSERSNSDDTFYDADDGSFKYFDAANDNFNGGSKIQEEKLHHYDFDNLRFNARNQNEIANFSNFEELNVDIGLEEGDLNQKDCDLDGYFQFLNKSIKQSDEAPQKMLGGAKKHSYTTAGECKCGYEECCCELQPVLPDTSSAAECYLEDESCSQRNVESIIVGVETSNQIKSKKSIEFSSKKKVEDENDDEILKWRKWRSPQEKLVSSSDSE